MKKYIAIILCLVSCACFSQDWRRDAFEKRLEQLNQMGNSGEISTLERRKQGLMAAQTYYPQDELLLGLFRQYIYEAERLDNKKITLKQYEKYCAEHRKNYESARDAKRSSEEYDAMQRNAANQRAAEAQAEYDRAVIYSNMLKNRTTSAPRQTRCVTTGYGATATTTCY